MSNIGKEIYHIGETPELGVIPEFMHAWTITEERFGEPITAFCEEIVPVPTIEADEMLIYNMAAGINYNGVWAALGKPLNVLDSQLRYHKEIVDFHICGSESSGIVYAVGENIKRFKVGDKVIVGGSQYNPNDIKINQGIDPILLKSYRVWGYESNWGAFAQFSKVKEIQCVKKPDCLNWIESAGVSVTGVTSYKMLTSWEENKIKPGDVVLIWGGSGGLGSIAIQLVNYFGGIPVAVVSSEERGKECLKLGAKGCINRKKYTHWGMLDYSYTNKKFQEEWLRQAISFRREIWDIVGERKSPAIVFEHSGSNTLPTSLFVCGNGGMVVLCGGTTGYVGTVDLRYLWLNQKRIQGSHAGTEKDFINLIKVIEQSNIKPYITKVFDYDQVAIAHQMIYKDEINSGKMVIRIGLNNKSDE